MSSSLTLIKWDAVVRLGREVISAARSFDSFAISIASSLNQIGRMAEIAGMSVEQFQEWSFVAKMADIDVNQFAIGMKMLSKTIVEAASGSGDGAKAMKAMGISVKDSYDQVRPMADILKDIMDKFSGYEDGANKVSLATVLFGRAGSELIPLLNKGSKSFEELAREARKLGIILSPELVEKGSLVEDQLKKINAQIEVQIGISCHHCLSPTPRTASETGVTQSLKRRHAERSTASFAVRSAQTQGHSIAARRSAICQHRIPSAALRTGSSTASGTQRRTPLTLRSAPLSKNAVCSRPQYIFDARRWQVPLAN